MVAYVTAEDIRSAVARDLDNTAGTAAVLDNPELELASANAQAEVDARLRGRYPVPFSPVPGLVFNVVVDIAAYLATLTYRGGKDLSANDPIVLRYNRAQMMLKMIADGNADLDIGDGGLPSPSTGGGLGRPMNPYGSGLLTAGTRIDYYSPDRWL